jgi:hypothetical protein
MDHIKDRSDFSFLTRGQNMGKIVKIHRISNFDGLTKVSPWDSVFRTWSVLSAKVPSIQRKKIQSRHIPPLEQNF